MISQFPKDFELISGGFLQLVQLRLFALDGSGIVVEKWPHFFLFETAMVRQPPWSLEDGL